MSASPNLQDSAWSHDQAQSLWEETTQKISMLGAGSTKSPHETVFSLVTCQSRVEGMKEKE